MPDDRKILRAIRKQIARGASQYLLVAICAVGAVATVTHGATHATAKFDAVLAAMKRH
ncbi:MAG: hypothetical protein NTZ72_08895 [Afipia sp.]|nr:hypothetical protein [Afipia sp.]